LKGNHAKGYWTKWRGNLFWKSSQANLKLNNLLLIIGRTEVTMLTRKAGFPIRFNTKARNIHGALCKSEPGKAVAQNATVQVAVDQDRR
jgi:hypothetical protein